MTLKCKPRIVLFDFDGTIVDTMNEYAEAAAELISKYTSLSIPEARRRYLETSGRTFRDQLVIIGVPGEKLEEIAFLFEEKKKEILEKHKPQKIVWKRLASLRKCGIKTALSTNNECKLIQRISWINKLFDIILCHEPGTNMKKGLGHLKALEEMGYKRCEIIFIGDSEYDLEVYRPYGIRSIKTRGLWRPDDTAIREILGEAGCEA